MTIGSQTIRFFLVLVVAFLGHFAQANNGLSVSDPLRKFDVKELMKRTQSLVSKEQTTQLRMTHTFYSVILGAYFLEGDGEYRPKYMANKKYLLMFLNEWASRVNSKKYSSTQAIFDSIREEPGYLGKHYSVWERIQSGETKTNISLGHARNGILAQILKSESIIGLEERLIFILDEINAIMVSYTRQYELANYIFDAFKDSESEKVRERLERYKTNQKLSIGFNVIGFLKDIFVPGAVGHRALKFSTTYSNTTARMGSAAMGAVRFSKNKSTAAWRSGKDKWVRAVELFQASIFSNIPAIYWTALGSIGAHYGAAEAWMIKEGWDEEKRQKVLAQLKAEEENPDTFRKLPIAVSLVRLWGHALKDMPSLNEYVPRNFAIEDKFLSRDVLVEKMREYLNGRGQGLHFLPIFLNSEKFFNIDRRDVDDHLAHDFLNYHFNLARKDVAAQFGNKRWLDSSDIEGFRSHVIEHFLKSYKENYPNLTALGLGWGGNCVSQTLLITGILSSYQNKIGEDFALGVVQFSDHIEPVLYRQGEVRFLMSGKVKPHPIGRLLRPEYLIYRTLNAMGAAQGFRPQDFFVRGFGGVQNPSWSISSPDPESLLTREGPFKSFTLWEALPSASDGSSENPESATVSYKSFSAMSSGPGDNTGLNPFAGILNTKNPKGSDASLEEKKEAPKPLHNFELELDEPTESQKLSTRMAVRGSAGRGGAFLGYQIRAYNDEAFFQIQQILKESRSNREVLQKYFNYIDAEASQYMDQDSFKAFIVAISVSNPQNANALSEDVVKGHFQFMSNFENELKKLQSDFSRTPNGASGSSGGGNAMGAGQLIRIDSGLYNEYMRAQSNLGVRTSPTQMFEAEEQLFELHKRIDGYLKEIKEDPIAFIEAYNNYSLEEKIYANNLFYDLKLYDEQIEAAKESVKSALNELQSLIITFPKGVRCFPNQINLPEASPGWIFGPQRKRDDTDCDKIRLSNVIHYNDKGNADTTNLLSLKAESFLELSIFFRAGIHVWDKKLFEFLKAIDPRRLSVGYENRLIFYKFIFFKFLKQSVIDQYGFSLNSNGSGGKYYFIDHREDQFFIYEELDVLAKNENECQDWEKEYKLCDDGTPPDPVSGTRYCEEIQGPAGRNKVDNIFCEEQDRHNFMVRNEKEEGNTNPNLVEVHIYEWVDSSPTENVCIAAVGFQGGTMVGLNIATRIEYHQTREEKFCNTGNVFVTGLKNFKFINGFFYVTKKDFLEKNKPIYCYENKVLDGGKSGRTIGLTTISSCLRQRDFTTSQELARIYLQDKPVYQLCTQKEHNENTCFKEILDALPDEF